MGNRGLANRALYLARLLLDGWQLAARDAADPAALDAAYLAAARQQLLQAYGWFLLAVSGADTQLQPQLLPRAVAELPPPEPGRASAPELQEFAALERDGWLAEMLREPPLTAAPVPARALASDRPSADPRAAQRWLRALQDTMARMDDSLNEC